VYLNNRARFYRDVFLNCSVESSSTFRLNDYVISEYNYVVIVISKVNLDAIRCQQLNTSCPWSRMWLFIFE